MSKKLKRLAEMMDKAAGELRVSKVSSVNAEVADEFLKALLLFEQAREHKNQGDVFFLIRNLISSKSPVVAIRWKNEFCYKIIMIDRILEYRYAPDFIMLHVKRGTAEYWQRVDGLCTSREDMLDRILDHRVRQQVEQLDLSYLEDKNERRIST